jgi:galactokinase
MKAIAVPGRVNLIGEHIDYHNLPVLPMAIQRGIRIEYQATDEGLIRAHSEIYGVAEICLNDDLQPGLAGDWSNYLRAAVKALKTRWKIAHGIEAKVTSDLPAAAGLSSSSALLAGFTIALLRANGIEPTVNELMEVLPDGEQFVGTRGGGMDHAAVLAGGAGCALLVEFAPLRLTDVPIPDNWSFIVAHSLRTAEKSGAVREQYNSPRVAGQRALAKLHDSQELSEEERRALRHVTSEHERVKNAVAAMRRCDKRAFGELLCESHRSLRDDLRVSCAQLDELVDLAMKNKALGARLTGAGFGGCAVVFCERSERERMAQALVDEFYAKRSGFDRGQHLIFAEPSAGALRA